MRLWSSYVHPHFILFTLQYQLVTTILTRVSSASTWVAILLSWVSLGTSLSAWAVRTPMIILSVSACLHSLATPARRLMVCLSSTDGFLRRCSLQSGTATILRRITLAMLPMAFTSQHGQQQSGSSFTASISTRTSCLTRATRISGRPSIM